MKEAPNVCAHSTDPIKKSLQESLLLILLYLAAPSLNDHKEIQRVARSLSVFLTVVITPVE